jgi:phage tail sheath gpL-like
MAIAFNNIPNTTRVPFVSAEFNATQAQQGPALLPYAGLLIGQKLAAGSATADMVVLCTGVDDAIAKAGRGSILHRMAIAWFASNKSTPVWLGVLADNGAGVAATGTIAFTAAATGSGPIAFYFGGVRVLVGVNGGDATTVLATNTAAAITANPDLPITASVTGSTVTYTFRNKGPVGNSYDVRHSFNDGEGLPAGVGGVGGAGLTITAMSGGTSNPSLTNLIAAMGDLWFQIWAHPYTDAASLKAIEDELASRFAPPRQMDGLAITFASGTLSTLTTLGNSRNSQSSTIVAPPGQSPLTPPMELAAETAALVAFYAAQDPARPFQTLALKNAMPTAVTDQWSGDERDLLLHDGIATTKLAPGGVVQLERLITTYQHSPSGAADTAYLDATTPLTLLYLRYSWRVLIQNKYPRHKLADDGTLFGVGQAVMTPSLGRAEALTWFRDMEELGLVENYDAFKANLVVERNAQNPNRLDWLLPPDLINQLIGAAASIQFRL